MILGKVYSWLRCSASRLASLSNGVKLFALGILILLGVGSALVLQQTKSIHLGESSLTASTNVQSPSSTGSGSGTANNTVLEWLTTSDFKAILQQTSTNFSSGASSSPTAITVDDNSPQQRIEGFGASLTDTAAYLLKNSSYGKQVMSQLFDPTHGLGLSVLRQPIGSSDFTVGSYYSLDDIPCAANSSTVDDSNLQCFSIARDQQNMIPMIKEAQQFNPAIEVFATPWSAPAWMKTNHSLLGNILDSNGVRGGTLKSNEQSAYATYLVKFIQAYQAQGIPIYALTILNEPGITQSTTAVNYPGMYWSPYAQANFLQTVFTQQFMRNNNVDPKILAYDWSSPQLANYISSLRNAPGLTGTAFHCYHGYPSDSSQYIGDLYEDECSTSISDHYAATASNPLAPIDAIIDGIRAGSKTIMFWNAALDQNNGPRPSNNTQGCGGCTPLVVIPTTNNVPSGKPSYTAEYYAMQQVSKFVKPGSYRINSPTFDNYNLKDVAFKNPDGSIVLIVHNLSQSPQTIAINYHDRSFSSAIPSGAIATYRWQSDPADLPVSVQSLSKTWYFAEGYKTADSTTKFTIFNPNHVAATISVRYETGQDGIITKTYVAPAFRTYTWNANNDIPVATTVGGFGTIISSNEPISAEREVMFVATQAGGVQPGVMSTPGTTSPQTSWYFAEGTTRPGFAEYLQVFNPQTSPAQVTLVYYPKTGSPVTKTFAIPPQKRQTINVANATSNANGQSQSLGIGPNLDVSAKITSDTPVVAERVMYFNVANNNPGGEYAPATIAGGDATMGANSLSTKFYFAEGATYANFNEYFSLFNPGSSASNVTITYFVQNGQEVVRSFTIPALKRSTVTVWLYNAATDPGGLGQSNVSVAATISSSLPILAERPLYFAYQNENSTSSTKGQFLMGGSSVIGSSQLGKTVVFTYGETAANYNEYLSLLNPNSTAADISVTYLTTDGFSYVKQISLPPNTRQTITVFMQPSTTAPANLGSGSDYGGLSVVLHSNVPIFAEQPLYGIFQNENLTSGDPEFIPSGSDIPGVLLETAQ